MAIEFPLVSWARNTNIYEVNIRQYTPEGSFAAFAKHLPRLKSMGVEILWLMPITPISEAVRQGSLGSYYACSSYTAINPEYGDLDDFKQLVKAIHAQGMYVIIDWVANHTGWDHHWTKEHPDWYVLDAEGNFTEKNGWHDVIDLNYSNKDMRAAMIEAMQFWVKETSIDGFRCDMAHLVPLDFWKEARKACDAIKHLFWLAECEVTDYHQVFDLSYAWHWMHTTEKYAKGEVDVQSIQQVLHSYSQYPAGTHKLFFTSNHDENSWNGTEYEKYGPAALPWSVFTATWKGVPLIYGGQELPNHKRLAFFDKDLIEWNDRPALKDWYCRLLDLRKEAGLQEAETFVLPVSHPHVLAYLRRNKGKVVLVLLNLSSESRLHLSVSHEWVRGNFRSWSSGLQYAFKTENLFELQAYEAIVYVSA
jgi:glycosidase